MRLKKVLYNLVNEYGYFPKGTNVSKITDKQVAQVESRINNRARKCLGYKTPLEGASVFVAL